MIDDLVKGEVGVSSDSGPGSSSSSDSSDSKDIWCYVSQHTDKKYTEEHMFTVNQRFYRNLHVKGTEFKSREDVVEYMLKKLGKERNSRDSKSICNVKRKGASGSPVYRFLNSTFRFELGLRIDPELLKLVRLEANLRCCQWSSQEETQRAQSSWY